MQVAIIDYGAGNIQSLVFALNRLDTNVIVSNDKQEILQADKVIFPGVGHASTAMSHLSKTGLDQFIPTLTQDTLGICLGMQLMCESTEEGQERGLAIFPTKVKKFVHEYKIPHVGWNKIKSKSGKLFNEIPINAYFYCVHSYYVEQNSFSSANMQYGIEFSATIQKDNFYACQFHPEKSGKTGEQFLKNFLDI